jgi:hypothetical protein
MDYESPEKAKLDARARRARTIIIVVMAVLITAPWVVYLFVAKGGAPRP